MQTFAVLVDEKTGAMRGASPAGPRFMRLSADHAGAMQATALTFDLGGLLLLDPGIGCSFKQSGFAPDAQ